MDLLKNLFFPVISHKFNRSLAYCQKSPLNPKIPHLHHSNFFIYFSIQHVISCHWVWLQSLAPPTALQSVQCSLSVMPWRFLTYRHGGSIRLWTTGTVFTSTCTQTTPPSAGPCSTLCTSTNGRVLP